MILPSPMFILASPNGGYGDDPIVWECPMDENAARSMFWEYASADEPVPMRAFRIDLDPDTNLPEHTTDVTEEWVKDIAAEFYDDGESHLPEHFAEWIDLDAFQPNWVASREAERQADYEYEWRNER